MRVRPLLVRVAAVLCLIAASCSDEGGSGPATRAPGTSSTLPSPEAAAAGVDASARAHPPQPPAAPGRRSDPSNTPPTETGNGQRATSTTATGGTTTTTTVPPGLPPEKCPDARTCRRYVFVYGNADASKVPRWPTGPDGRVTIRYSINPAHSGLSSERVRGAIEAAFATWQAAAPKLRFVFDGFTSRLPTPGDGHTDVGWAPGGTRAFAQNDGAVLVEADMLFAPAGDSWTWEPCEQRDSSCTNTNVAKGTGTCCRSELQAVATHEAGHWLGLGDMYDETLDAQLTMNPNPPFEDRFRSTLALGDVLGVRALYPCSCPLPPVYSP